MIGIPVVAECFVLGLCILYCFFIKVQPQHSMFNTGPLATGTRALSAVIHNLSINVEQEDVFH